MPCITWTKDLSVGNPFIDQDHHVLVALVNTLYDALIHEEDARNVLMKALDDLIEFTASHFAREEQEMRRIGYAGYEAHKLEHDRLLQQLMVFQNKYCAGTINLPLQMTFSLRDWLVDHIVHTDKPFATAIGMAAVADAPASP